MKTIKKIVKTVWNSYIEVVELQYRPYFQGR